MTPSKASARMTPTAPDQTPASEVTPIEQMATELAGGVDTTPWDPEARAVSLKVARIAATALLSGDWLKDVLTDHSDWFIREESTEERIVYGCQGCDAVGSDTADGSDLTETRAWFAAHQAAAIRAAAGATR